MKALLKIGVMAGLVSLILTACRKTELGIPPASTVADFTYTVSNNGYAPCTVTFQNKSLNAKGYHWDFGNGQTSTEAEPSVTYDTPGLYTVTLTCVPENDVYYNQLVKTVAINIKDPLAGLTQVLYFTTRNSSGGGVHLAILGNEAPVVQDFESVELSRPYGMTVDTAGRKVFVSDYNLGVIYRFDADGKNPVKILDVSVAGQEIVDYPHGMVFIQGKLYWGRQGGIYRCNPDGTGAEVVLNTSNAGPEFPLDMQYDPSTDRIYFVNDKYDFSGGLYSVKPDGSGLTEILPAIDGTALEIDSRNGKMYLAIYGSAGSPVTENGIYMCNLDGTGLTKIGEFGNKATWGIALDTQKDKLLWSYKISNSNPDGKIVRANLDGSQPEDFITGISPHAMQVVFIKL